MDNKSIFKYVIANNNFGDHIESLEVPVNAEFLTINAQGDNICAWFIVDPDEESKEAYMFAQIGTGHLLPGFIRKEHFLGTIVNDEAGLVWHMFGGKPNINESAVDEKGTKEIVLNVLR